MKTVTLALGLLCTLAAGAQKNELSVLNNRFYFVFPDSAKNMARRGDIMGPGPNENNETRIVYDEGDKRLVFFAREMGEKTVPNLEMQINKKSTAKNPFVVKRVYDSADAVALLLNRQKFDSTKDAILLSSLIIQNRDSTISRMDALINPAAFVDRSRFEQIIEKVFATFRPGERHLNLTRHTDTVSIEGSKTTMQIKLPQGYTLSHDMGEDFEVYRIELVTAYGADESSSITIYFGSYPSKFSREYELDDFKIADTQEELMFHKSNWDNYFDPKRNLFLREQIFNDDEIEKGMLIHIAILSNKKERVEEMSAIVKDLLIVYDPAHVK